jgi:hypothetical protein
MTTFESAPKPTTDVRRLVADYIGRVPLGETIGSVLVSSSIYTSAVLPEPLEGEPEPDPPAALWVDDEVIDGTKVTTSVGGGQAGSVYQITFLATLSDGQLLTMRTLLAVTPDAL